MILSIEANGNERSVAKVHARKRASACIFLGLLGALAGACSAGAGSDQEPVTIDESAFSQTSCAGVTANHSFTGDIDPGFTTPQTYNTCTKGYVIDITSYASAYTGQGSGGCSDAILEADYGDSVLSQTDCPNYEVRAILYHRVSGSWVVVADQDVFGTWIFGSCALGTGFTGMIAGDDYRIAVTSRAPDTSTRKVTVTSFKPVHC